MLIVTVVFLLNKWLTPPELKPRKLFSSISGSALQTTHCRKIHKRLGGITAKPLMQRFAFGH